MSAILLNRLRKLQQGLEQRRAAMRAKAATGTNGVLPICSTRSVCDPGWNESGTAEKPGV